MIRFSSYMVAAGVLGSTTQPGCLAAWLGPRSAVLVLGFVGPAMAMRHASEGGAGRLP
jgi:hypothetical protein